MADRSLNSDVAALDNTTWDHRWGFKDTRFIVKGDGSAFVTGGRYAVSGYDMPGLIPFAEEMLDIKIDVQDVKQERDPKPVPQPCINEAFWNAVQEAFPLSRYTLDPRERLIHSHGQTTADEVASFMANWSAWLTQSFIANRKKRSSSSFPSPEIMMYAWFLMAGEQVLVALCCCQRPKRG